MFGLGVFSGTGVNGVVIIIFYVLAILMALILHEVAHGLVACWCGDLSAKDAGRLSLNPAKHLDPLGTLCFILFGFGWAVPVPINPQNFRHPRRDAVWVALAGIIMNLLLAFVASFFFVLLYDKSVWCYFFEYVMLINIVFATFNILPIAPLDGFNLMAALAPRSAYVRFMDQNRLVAMLILVAVVYFTNVLGFVQGGLIALFLDFWGLIL